MARSGGVTFSAVVVLIGSSLTILFGALMALAILWTPNAGQAANLPIPIGYVVTAEAIVFFGFGGWGIASGVGLIKLRQWSRVSMMIYGAILLFFSVIPGIVLSFIPLPAATDPSVPPSFMTTFRVIMVGFYALLAALAGFWLYFFNKKSVKAQFVAEPTDGPTVRLALRRPGARPLSITIIGWFFLVSAVLTPFGLLFAKTNVLRPGAAVLFPGGIRFRMERSLDFMLLGCVPDDCGRRFVEIEKVGLDDCNRITNSGDR
jgi:hypothetical protein